MDIDNAEYPPAETNMDIDDHPDIDFHQEFGDIDLSGIPSINTDIELPEAYDFDEEFADVDLSGIPAIRSDIDTTQEYDFNEEFGDIDLSGIPVIGPEPLLETDAKSSARPSGPSGYHCNYGKPHPSKLHIL